MTMHLHSSLKTGLSQWLQEKGMFSEYLAFLVQQGGEGEAEKEYERVQRHLSRE